MILRTPRSPRTDTLLPYTTLFRSVGVRVAAGDLADRIGQRGDLPDRLHDAVDATVVQLQPVEHGAGSTGLVGTLHVACVGGQDVGATTIDGVGHLRQQRRTAGRIERGDRVRSRTGALGKGADVAGHGILLVQCMTAATWSSSTRLSRRTTALPLWKPRTSSISWLWRPEIGRKSTSLNSSH